MNRHFAILLLLLAACPKNNGEGSACTVTTDCQSGLFCVGGVCKANIGSGAQCTSASDCKAQEACVGGKCGQFGCDSAHGCNNGCCNGDQCVATDGCSGSLKCASNGMCPARCDTASGGNGCSSGCCDGATGACADGTTNAACGTSAACIDCGQGASCVSQACSCTACGGSTVCSNGACVDCASNPCSGQTPFCDANSTHACQPCTNAPADFCTGATPYCNTSGACGATCDAASTCPNGLSCDVANHVCNTSCTPDTTDNCGAAGTYCTTGGFGCLPTLAVGQSCNGSADCSSGSCDCASGDCSIRVCTAGCPACTYAEPPGAANPGACDGGNVGPIDTPTFNCGPAGGDCSDGGACACDGAGNCGNADGTACDPSNNDCGSPPCDWVQQDTNCTSGNCVFGESTGAGAVNVCSKAACGWCGYSTDGATCNPIAPSGSVTAFCDDGGFQACDGNNHCAKVNGILCDNDADCISGFCVHSSATDASATGMKCADTDCGACSYYSGGSNGTGGNCNSHYGLYATSSIVVGVGDSDQACDNADACDGSGNCKVNNGFACGRNSECLDGQCSCADTYTLDACGVAGDGYNGPCCDAGRVCLGSTETETTTGTHQANCQYYDGTVHNVSGLYGCSGTHCSGHCIPCEWSTGKFGGPSTVSTYCGIAGDCDIGAGGTNSLGYTYTSTGCTTGISGL